MSLRTQFEARLQQITEEQLRLVGRVDAWTDALRAVIEAEPPKPAPIEVRMRLHPIVGGWQGQAFLGSWWVYEPVRYWISQTLAQENAERWLARISDQLGVPLKPVWEDDATEKQSDT